MTDERRTYEGPDRRARRRGGRRASDARKPWYMRRRVWLATASLLYIGWRKMKTLATKEAGNGLTLAA